MEFFDRVDELARLNRFLALGEGRICRCLQILPGMFLL